MSLSEVVGASYLQPYSPPHPHPRPQDLKAKAGVQAEQRCIVVHGAGWIGAASACIQCSARLEPSLHRHPGARTYFYQTGRASQCALLFQLTKSGFESLAKCSSHQGRPLSLQNPGPALVPVGGSRAGVVVRGCPFQHDIHEVR